MYESSNVCADTFCSLSSSSVLRSPRSDPASDDELPLMRTVIMGTAPATAGLKLGAAEGTSVGDVVGDGTAWLANTKAIGYCVAPPSGNTKQSGAATQALRAAAIACTSAMPTPDPGLKNTSAWIGSLDDSSTTMFDGENIRPDSICSLSSNASLSAASSGSVSDAELPMSKTVILGTAPAPAGLKLGAADGLKLGAGEGLGVGATVGDVVGEGTACEAKTKAIGYCVAPPSGNTKQSGSPM